jgi:hypothetical protein
MATALSKSNKGWHKQWFYLKNDPDTPLPIFSGHLIEEPLQSWGWGPIDKEKRRLGDLLKAIVLLKAAWPPHHRRRRGIPCEEGGTTSGARAPAAPDDAHCVA